MATSKISSLITYYENLEDRVQVDDGLLAAFRAGHTAETASLEICHPGRDTAARYAAGTALGALDEASGAEALRALAALEVNDSASERHGAFRWYSEETAVRDTNAGFFTLVPLVLLKIVADDAIPRAHIPLLDALFAPALRWFVRECERPSLFYPNKTLSDGAICLALGTVLGDEKARAAAERFFERWDEYTSRRGWGWGENCSVVYAGVMVNALQIAQRILPEGNLRSRLLERIDAILDNIRFHGARELVPTIRSYNLDGYIEPPGSHGMLWAISGARPLANANDSSATGGDVYSGYLSILQRMLYADRLDASPIKVPTARPERTPRTRRERVFDGALACTWICEHGRLGSLTRFPVMNGSYQHPTWGLGWQTFPVSCAVDDHQVSFLRWYVDDGTRVRTHPAITRAFAYLDSALFGDEPYPEVLTVAAQENHLLLCVRSMTHLANNCAEIADEWVVHRFTGTLREEEIDGRRWAVLDYGTCALRLSPLTGIRSDSDQPQSIRIEADERDGTLKLRQVLHRGSAGVLRHPRLEAGWAIAFGTADKSDLHVEDEIDADDEEPRDPPFRRRNITLADGSGTRARLVSDPYCPNLDGMRVRVD